MIGIVRIMVDIMATITITLMITGIIIEIQREAITEVDEMDFIPDLVLDLLEWAGLNSTLGKQQVEASALIMEGQHPEK